MIHRQILTSRDLTLRGQTSNLLLEELQIQKKYNYCNSSNKEDYKVVPGYDFFFNNLYLQVVVQIIEMEILKE